MTPPVGVGFVGAGAIAGVHLDALAETPGTRFVGVTDCDGARAQALVARARRRHPDAIAAANVAALAAAGARVIHVLTPPHAHVASAREALAEGCDVLVEKPLATDDDDCAGLAAAAERAGRRVGVNHSLLADPQVARVLALLRSGRAGSAVSAEYFCSAAYPPWGSGPMPAHYRDGGNPFRDLGVHGLYLLRACLGEIEAVEPSFDSGRGDPNLCFDEWHVVVRCARGIGHIRLSWNVRPLQTIFTVHATRGTLRADVGCMFTAARRPTGLPHAVDRAAAAMQDAWPALRAISVNGVGWLAGRVRPYPGVRAAIRAFHARLADGGPLPASVDDGCAVVRWVEAVARRADDAKRARSRRYRPAGHAATLVTGASGLLGARIVAALVADGARVRALCRRPPTNDLLHHPHVEIVLGDLGDALAVDGAVARVDMVVHAGAAMQGGWPEHERGTVTGTAHVVASALQHGVQRFVHVSSLSVLDWTTLDGQVVTEDAPLEPAPEARGAYTRAKRIAESLVQGAVGARGLPALIVRPGVLIGPEGVTPSALGTFVVGRRLVVLGDGRAHPPLVSVDAVVEGIRRLLYVDAAPGTIVHMVGPQHERVDTLARQLAAERGLRRTRVPWPILLGGTGAIAVLSRALGRDAPLSRYRIRAATADLSFDCTRARELIGWTPELTTSTAPSLQRVAH